MGEDRGGVGGEVRLFLCEDTPRIPLIMAVVVIVHGGNTENEEGQGGMYVCFYVRMPLGYH